MANNPETNPSEAPDPAPEPAETWHIVQRSEGSCDIVTHTELGATDGEPQNWGPFASRFEAIAKRVGLIRAGKCLPK